MTTELQNKSSIETAPLEQRVNQYVINVCTVTTEDLGNLAKNGRTKLRSWVKNFKI